ncbi:MAG: nucleotidyl transferase AbiEii/AbiGii toxin family protein [Acidobacteriota bacterium]|nr:nucleotidyl transferase AbiEii/AbiGii toxin family protein [Acidobacteriota bacterium]
MFTGRVDAARVHMQIDIGFGDVVTPGPERLNYPTILDFPAPVLSGYSRETVMEEKLQALVQLRMSNTRMKDYFDLWLLSRQPELNKDTLREAIQRTFENRKMEIEVDPVGLSEAFGTDPTKQVQWKAFLKRSAITEAPEDLTEAVEEIRLFFAPILVPFDKADELR